MVLLIPIGSSPHTWRIQIKAKTSGGKQGIISTYVENTRCSNTIRWRGRDHLHIRGEYVNKITLLLINQGSSPHTWRILASVLALLMLDRIISTYVENTKLSLLKYQMEQDHLHIRGEYSLMLIQHKRIWGSSPHTWRILKLPSVNFIIFRIISTYVENTSWVKIRCQWKRDHLHIRGEYREVFIGFDYSMGSSPHTWRIQRSSYLRWNWCRIISTYVENTLRNV